jgi:predicted enzyme related to lactoylglutathione lyase
MKLSLTTFVIFAFDVNLMKEFYTKHFHLAVTEEIKDEWVVLQAGNCNIGLHRVGEAYRHLQPSASSEKNTKLVFETEDDIVAIREELLGKGVAMREIKSFDNYPFWLCDGEDPEGNVFQIKKKK